MLSQAIGRIGKWVSGSHLLIAVAASAFTHSAYLQLSIPPDVPLIVFIGFATLFTYNIQSLMGRYRTAGQTDFESHRYDLIFTGIGATGMAICLYGITDWKVVNWFVIPALLALLYSTPVFSFRRIRITLREVPYLKIYIILVVWLWVSAIIPYFNNRTGLTPDFILFCVQRVLFLFTLLIPFDIRDLKIDYAFQKTIPQMIGVRRSLWLAVMALIGYGLISMLRWLDGSIDFFMLAALLITGVITSGLIVQVHEHRSPLYFTLLIDSMLWVQPALIWLLR